MKTIIAMAAAGLLALPLAAAPSPQAISQKPLIGITKAVATAERLTNGKVVEAELDRSRKGHLIYEIELETARGVEELDLDARTGRVMARRNSLIRSQWSRWFGNDRLDLLAQLPQLSGLLDDLEDRSGGKVIDVSYDVEDGQARYEVELSTRAGVTHVYLNPRTGERLAMVHDD